MTSFLVIGAIYFKSLPHTVQILDSGELVTASTLLTVPHPPGFPLAIWFYASFIKLLSFGSVFWRAAFLTSLFSFGSLAVLAFRVPSLLFFCVACVPLAFTPPYWKYSLLPDVFMLNAFFLTVIGAIYFWESNSLRRLWKLFILFALGCLNHPTLVFALPFLVDAWREDGRWKSGMLPCIAALVMVCGGYASLLLLHPEHLFSWGHLQSLHDVILHAIRNDYGVFQLSAQSESADFLKTMFHLSGFFVMHTPLALGFALLPSLLFFFRSTAVSRRYWVGVFTFFFYCVVFFSRANLGEEAILERFYLFPLILLTLLAAFGVSQAENKISVQIKSLFLSAGILLASLSYFQNSVALDFSWNTIVDDYARNLLKNSNDDLYTVFIAHSDTRCFALRYLQGVEGFHRDALVLCSGNIFDSATLEKLKVLRPSFQVDPDWNQGEHARDIIYSIVRPNIAHDDFIFTNGVNLKNYRVTFLGLGRRVSAGEGMAFDPQSLASLEMHSDPSRLPASLQSNEYKALYSEYAYYFLKEGLSARTPEQALQSFEKALQRVPYCTPALENRCRLLRNLNQADPTCDARLEQLRTHEARYF